MNDEFLILNIKEYLKLGTDGEIMLHQIFSSFSCKLNSDVERFLLNQSIEFTKKNQSVTYIVISPTQGTIVGYFTITIKPITINVETFSNTVKRKIARVSEQNTETGNYSLSAYLIAQLGKNYSDSVNELITGRQLLDLAIEKIKELQYMVGGMVVFLEAENNEKLLNFYEIQNNFKQFATRETLSSVAGNHNLIQLLKIL
ncbi:GNAT family acetyltransferase [Agathobacter sp.]